MSVKQPKQTVLNPPIPISISILDGLHPGEMVLIQGSVLDDADRFQVDFTCGSSIKPRADVAFHFNPRFQKNHIVCNTLELEYWGKEEIHYLMPFRKGAEFEIIVLVEKDLYKVAVNGTHVLEYKHRIDLARVDTLSVSGKVQIQAIGFIPSTALLDDSCDMDNMIVLSVMINCVWFFPFLQSLPFKRKIIKGLIPGHTITIKGLIPAFAHRYLFKCKKELCNTMIILCEAQQFKLAVNGAHQLTYKHRVQDLSRVDELEIIGDLELLEVKIW
ncbi:galectin-8 isoform X2 [Silurus asotus]|uniref:Galectin n=1 Tax=Silurus asotus TaxID=30991 RepID=A0AAD5A1I2_SILAS|nr:galectin-8 isoform X2 [Silurus asotus]